MFGRVTKTIKNDFVCSHAYASVNVCADFYRGYCIRGSEKNLDNITSANGSLLSYFGTSLSYACAATVKGVLCWLSSPSGFSKRPNPSGTGRPIGAAKPGILIGKNVRVKDNFLLSGWDVVYTYVNDEPPSWVYFPTIVLNNTRQISPSM